MADRDEGVGAPHPWESEPDRMADDLRYELRQVQDALQRPATAFQPTRHGVVMQHVLEIMRKALKKGRAKDLEALERLGLDPEATAGDREATSSEISEDHARLAAAQALAHKFSQQAATDEGARSALDVQATQLTADLKRERAELAVARSEIKRLLAQASATKGSFDEYAAVGSVDEFRAYARLGSAQDVSRQLESLRAAAGVALRATAVYDLVASQYEVILGPLLLALERRSMALEGVLAATAEDSTLVVPTHRSLLLSLSSLGDDERLSVTPRGAIEALQAEIEEREASEGDLVRLPSADQLDRLKDFDDNARAVLRERLTGEDRPMNVPRVFQDMMHEVAVAAAQDTPSRKGRKSTAHGRVVRSASVGSADTDAAVAVDSDDGSAASDATATVRRVKNSKDTQLSAAVLQVLAGKAPPGILTFIPVDCGRAGAISQSVLVSIRSSAYEAFAKWNEPRPKEEGEWPEAPPETFDLPPSIADLAFTPWRLRLFEHEVYAPNAQATKTILKRTPEGRLLSVGEVTKFYASTPAPWGYLAQPPTPLTFSRRDPRFKRLCEHVDYVWVTHAQALWERAHYLLIDPKDPGASKFLEKRRRRNSDYAGAWNAALAFLLHVLRLDGLDADLLLDPYFPWAPVYGVIPLAGRAGQSVASVVSEGDVDTPEGTYFRGASASEHPIHTHGCVERIKNKFVRSSATTTSVSASAEAPPPTPSSAGKRRVPGPLRINESDDEMKGDDAPPTGAVEAPHVKRKRLGHDAVVEQAQDDPKRLRGDTSRSVAPSEAPDDRAAATPTVVAAGSSAALPSSPPNDTNEVESAPAEPLAERTESPQPTAGVTETEGEQDASLSPASQAAQAI